MMNLHLLICLKGETADLVSLNNLEYLDEEEELEDDTNPNLEAEQLISEIEQLTSRALQVGDYF